MYNSGSTENAFFPIHNRMLTFFLENIPPQYMKLTLYFGLKWNLTANFYFDKVYVICCKSYNIFHGIIL